MSTGSSIEWTDATWSPTTGCDRVSPGCDSCYAMTMARRLKAMGQAKYQRDGNPSTSGPGFGLTVHPDALTLPLRWRKPHRVFVDSMSDLFHKDVPDDFIAQVWAVMAVTPQHTYQILTKRHGRMRSLLNDLGFEAEVAQEAVGLHIVDGAPNVPLETGESWWPLRNCWLGVSVEDQKHADLRIPALLETPAVIRFLSCEPLIGPVQLDRVSDESNRWSTLKTKSVLQRACDQCDGWGTACGIDDCHFVNDGCVSWVIVGGESGGGARSCDPEWIRSLVQQCRTAGVAPFVKQLGSVWARENGWGGKGGLPEQWPEDLRIREMPS